MDKLNIDELKEVQALINNAQTIPVPGVDMDKLRRLNVKLHNIITHQPLKVDIVCNNINNLLEE